MNRCARIIVNVLMVVGMLWPEWSAASFVWECSAYPKQQMSVNAGGGLMLAEFGERSNVIGLSLVDIAHLYAGQAVTVGGLPLSACFMPGAAPATREAMGSIGIDLSAVERLSQPASIVPAHLYPVSSDAEMLACISHHFPAVGYLEIPTQAPGVDACF